MLRFALRFFTIQGVLFTLQLWEPVRRSLIEPFTAGLAGLAVTLVRLFDDGVIASGVVLRDTATGFAVSIEAGCNGVEALIVLAAAILAVPATWKDRAWGLGLGVLAVQTLNLVRVISLFYLGRWNREIFEWTHLYLWQGLIMLDALIFWLLWLRMLPDRQPSR